MGVHLHMRQAAEDRGLSLRLVDARWGTSFYFVGNVFYFGLAYFIVEIDFKDCSNCIAMMLFCGLLWPWNMN